MFNVKGLIVAFTIAAIGAGSAAHASPKYNWTFTDQNGTAAGSGTLEMLNNLIVTEMTGTLYGKSITFYPNKTLPWTTPVKNGLHIQVNNPVLGESQVIGVPNTTGANYGFDDIYDFNDGVTYYGGILISTGSGSTLRVYIITRDSPTYDISTPTDFFSIDSNGTYEPNNGVFTISP
jgi:hypothetical protein